jgi:uncharacterized protein (DUF362 family)
MSVDRRLLLKGLGGAAVVGGAAGIGSLVGCGSPPAEPIPDLWNPSAVRKAASSNVAVLRAANYERGLEERVIEGIRLCGLEVRGKRVLLKPNLVEFDPHGVINTHPSLIAATVGAFRRLDALDVMVGEGPGHRRDNEHMLWASGLEAVLDEFGVGYVDLNDDAARPVPVQSLYSGMRSLFFPETLLAADLVVSMPKLKTHHWAGVTLSMKNLFGVMPGSIYGWPKNPLHWAGIDRSILDINASLPVPFFAIVDGIVGMEGNGPIQGTARPAGVLVFGSDPVAVDSTAARLMSIHPENIDYLEVAGRFLGNLDEAAIRQLGETIAASKTDFAVLERFAYLKDTAAKRDGRRAVAVG